MYRLEMYSGGSSLRTLYMSKPLLERDRQTDTDRQRDRDRHRQTERQTDKRDRQRQTDRDREEKETEAERQTDRETDRQTDRQRDRGRETERKMLTYSGVAASSRLTLTAACCKKYTRNTIRLALAKPSIATTEVRAYNSVRRLK